MSKLCPFLVFIFLLIPPQTVYAQKASLLLRGGTVYDGSGTKSIVADIAISGDKITEIGQNLQIEADLTLDAAKLVIAPGFIDLHTHSDRSIVRPQTRANLNYTRQGVTTIVTGNCGSGPTRVAELYESITKNGAGTNVIHLIPQGSLRREVIGPVDRPATATEIDLMKQIVNREMSEGTWGMATGLIYTPGSYATTEELIELARIVGERGGIYASHIRGEGKSSLLNAVREAIRIGRDASLPVHISHFKASGREAWGMVTQSAKLVEDARSAGLTVTADQYPYTASSTSLGAMLFSSKEREGGNEALTKKLEDGSAAKELRDSIADRLKRRGGPETIRIASYKSNENWVGKSLGEIAKTENRDVIDIVVEITRNGGAAAVSFSMSEDDVKYLMAKPYVATASDGSSRTPDSTRPHPRSYGCFPRKIGWYSIEQNVIPLTHAIRSASGLPADILGLKDRGYIKKNMFADIVVFDPNTFRDQATFDDPHQYATGVVHLIVNGVLVIKDGESTDKLPGLPLTRDKTGQVSRKRS